MYHQVKISEFFAIHAFCVCHSRFISGIYDTPVFRQNLGSGTSQGPEIAPIALEIKFYLLQAIKAVRANPTLSI